MAGASKHYLWIYGAGGMGKTQYALAVYRRRVGNGGRGVIIDPNATIPDELGHVMGVHRAADVLRRAGGRRYSLIIRPEWEEDVGALWRELFRAGRLLVMVDEAQEYGAAGSLDKEFLRLVQKGRNQNVDLATTCQSPVDLHPKIRLNFDAAVSFRQPVPQAAEQIDKMYFRSAGLASALMRLPRFHYLRATVQGEISRGRIPDPARRNT